jgi:chemotaxis protein CheX
MIEQNLSVFIDSTINYFNHTNTVPAKVGSPFLVESADELRGDYTGVISISGAYAGVCYFTAPTALLRHLMMSLGEYDTSESMLLDTVGEVANTLSGNARRELGNNFIISVPKVVKGIPEDSVASESKMYAIPISWKSYRATLGVNLAA